MIRSIDQLELAGRRVFIRADLDVPLDRSSGAVADDARILAALPTIQLALEKRARVILAGHLGKPEGHEAALSLEPVAARLAELLGGEVLLADDCTGDGVRKLVLDLREGQLLLLENLRFHPEEEAGGEAFARELAALVDVYLGDSLADARTASASTVALPRLVRERAAGLLLADELRKLQPPGARPGAAQSLPGLIALES